MKFKVGDTVDPRTLPVGAVFRHPSSYNRFVVEDASHCRGMISGAQFGLGDDPVVLLSLPSDPVELGTLAARPRLQPARLSAEGSPQVTLKLVRSRTLKLYELTKGAQVEFGGRVYRCAGVDGSCMRLEHEDGSHLLVRCYLIVNGTRRGVFSIAGGAA